MALIRGLRGLCPCPKCLVPKDQLSDLSQVYDLRTAKGTQYLLDEAAELIQADKEDLLKSHGLRNVQVSLSSMK